MDRVDGYSLLAYYNMIAASCFASRGPGVDL